MPTTSNFGWTTPADTDLVKDGAAAIRTLGNGIDTSLLDLKGGTSGQVLSKNSNTDLDYTWVTPNVGDITEVQAGVGISISSGTGPIPIVTNSSTDLITTAGDLLYGTAADTVARLGIGTAGQLLAVNSGATAPEWVAPPSSGSLTLIASGSLSGSTFTISSIPGTYRDIRLYLFNWSASGNGDLVCKINNTTADTFGNFESSNNTDWESGGSGGGFRLSSGQVPSSYTSNMGCMEILEYASTSAFKPISAFALTKNNITSFLEGWNGGGAYASNSAVTSIVLDPENASTFDNGTYALYGIN